MENVSDITVKNCQFDGVQKEPVKITGKTRNVKFDNLTVNGSLVLNKADQPYQAYSEWLTHSEMQRVAHPYNLDFSPNKPRWSYVMGIEMEGMLDTYLAYQNGKSTFKGGDAEANNERIIDYLGKKVKSFKPSRFYLAEDVTSYQAFLLPEERR